MPAEKTADVAITTQPYGSLVYGISIRGLRWFKTNKAVQAWMTPGGYALVQAAEMPKVLGCLTASKLRYELRP